MLLGLKRDNQHCLTLRTTLASPVMLRNDSCCPAIYFFQAEDGIRDWSVTGADVCSSDLMRRHTRLVSDWSSDVCSSFPSRRRHTRLVSDWSFRRVIFRSQQPLHSLLLLLRSEERRVGRECRSRWSP